MARSRSLSWKTIFVICFVILCLLLLYGNSLFVWRQTTIMITTNSPSNLVANAQYSLNNDNNTEIKPLSSSQSSEIEHIMENTLNTDNDNNNKAADEDDTIYIHEHIENYEQTQKTYNLYTNPYDAITANKYLDFVTEKDYLSFSECISSVNKDSREGKCTLSNKILFDIHDMIGSGNHGNILSVSIEFSHLNKDILPLNIDINRMHDKKYAIKHSIDNETCNILQFEYNIMKNIQSSNNMEIYYLTDLHVLIPWIEWDETNRFTRKTERKCILIMEQIENVKTFEGIIQKSYPPSFEYDNGLIRFLMNCYNELMIGLERLHLFNYYHIDINGVNILVWPRKNIKQERICYLIDYGGIFSMNYDAKTYKLFTGKSHNYSPFAYYNLYMYELRQKTTNFNLTKLNYFAIKDNQYRIIVEIMRFYLEYVELETEKIAYTENEYQYIKNAQIKQDEILHVIPVGINPSNETYIQYIWCLRDIQINNIIDSQLGTDVNNQIYNQKQKNQFLQLLYILQNAHQETNAINEKLCSTIVSKKDFD